MARARRSSFALTGAAAISFFLISLGAGTAFTALVVPTEIQQPGTQPGQVANLESPNKCDNCHGGYNRAVEPAFNWRGSMMANAGRDPIFWATVAVAEQDFPGSGDLCLRCHSVAGWHAGRSIPTDGSGLQAGDADGVECDSCHKMTNPNNAEHAGVMTAPFVANDEANPATGYYGSGMLSLFGGTAKLGPYSNVNPPHDFLQSKFHRDVDFCGSCHDVSNPAVGDLAHNRGKQPTGDSVFASGILGSLVNGKAAFNNFPYKYGVVERTFSEYKAGLLSKTPVSSYASLPADLKAGAIRAAYESAGGNYADGTTRYFSCQTCHMAAVTGQGCNKNPPVRIDLPLHDMTGGNVWAPDVILYQNSRGTLRLGGGLTATQIDAIVAGKERARQQLQLAASLSVSGNGVRVTNLTGHKLISGYPEGRRMWLNIKWYDAASVLLREDGKYGDLAVSTPGAPATVKTILDLTGTNTRIYEAHYAMTQEWAGQLLSLGYPASMAIAYDRVTGLPSYTLGQLAAQAPGTWRETFHFVLNNHVAKDNRIPTYGMSYEEARKRNALPVPATQFGNPGPGGTFDYRDEVALNPPANAHHATIELLYQSTSWEYIQFLLLANNRSNAFLADEGVNLMDAWANTGMAAPVVMASATWNAPPVVNHALTVAITGSGGGTVTSSPAGIACGADCSESFPASTVVTLAATPDATSTFGGWSGACTGSGACIVTMNAAKSVTATFTRITYALTVGKNGTGTGTVTSSPAGIACGVDCSESYASGTVVTLTTTTDATSTFGSWSGACTGSGACIVTMNAAKSVTATFTRITYALTAARSGTGAGTVTSSPAGIACGGDCGESYASGTVVTLTATPDATSTFGAWSGACTGTGPCIVTMNAAKSVTATFTRITYALMVGKNGTGAGTVTSSPSGITCGVDCAESYASGTVVTLTATPDATSTFGGWSGACTGTGTCIVTMTGARNVTATFSAVPPATYVLSVARSGAGSGTIASSPAGIDCGSSCASSFVSGTVVALVATPAPGSIFTGWSGDCSGTGACDVSMTSPASVVATFLPASFPLVVTRSGSGAGTVSSSPGGIDCGATCSADFTWGTVVTLLATPAAESEFAGWSGGGCSGTAACVVTLTTAASVDAKFEQLPDPPRLANLSTRASVGTGDNVAIAGFVIGGPTAKTVVVNATGPSLASFGIARPLGNPKLTLVRLADHAVLASNDDWQSAANAADIESSGFAPAHPLEPAILATLPPGAYTAIVEGADGGTGVALAAVYEVDHPEVPLMNISTRARVLVGDDVVIAGFVVQGSGAQTVVVNVAGPSLARFGVAGALADPMLILVRLSDGAVLAVNDSWQQAENAADIQASGMAPADPREPALLLTLPPGPYTAIVHGVGGTGVALVGVFRVP